MTHTWLILIAALGGVTGCSFEEVETTPQSRAEGKVPVMFPSTETTDPIDPFYLAIEAERWGVMIDHARGLLPQTVDHPADGDGRLRVHRALLNGVHSLISLRNEACLAGRVSLETCDHLKIPEWAFVYERTIPSLEDLQMRSDWLGEALQPFVSAMCTTDAGEWAIECSVE